MQLVLLSGAQGSGKSTLQKALIENCKRANFTNSENINFADIIYRMHDAALYQFSLFAPKEVNKKDGKLLQLLGTEWGRTVYGEDVWVDVMHRRLAYVKGNELKSLQNTLVVVGDCRFKNEFNAFPDALRVRLLAHEDVRRKRTTSWRENTLHPSETDLNEYELNNKFDLYLRTGDHYDAGQPVDSCVELILAQLQKNSWKEKRNG